MRTLTLYGPLTPSWAVSTFRDPSGMRVSGCVSTIAMKLKPWRGVDYVFSMDRPFVREVVKELRGEPSPPLVVFFHGRDEPPEPGARSIFRTPDHWAVEWHRDPFLPVSGGGTSLVPTLHWADTQNFDRVVLYGFSLTGPVERATINIELALDLMTTPVVVRSTQEDFHADPVERQAKGAPGGSEAQPERDATDEVS